MAKLIKLHRSRQNRMVAGVVGGIAEYLGWSYANLASIFLDIHFKRCGGKDFGLCS